MQPELMKSLVMVGLLATFSIGCGDSASSGRGHEHEGGDGEHEHMPEPPTDGGDELAQRACHGLHGESVDLQAAADHAGAESARVVVGETTVVHLPSGASGFAGIMIPHDHGDWGFFVDEPNVVVTVTAHDGTRFDINPHSPSESCPDDMQVDARVHIPAGGHYTIEFAAEGAREVTLQVLPEGEYADPNADPVSAGACEALGGEIQTVMASSAADEALAGNFVMTGGHFYHLVMPEGSSYVGVHLPTDHTDWAVFVSEEDVAFSLSHPDVGIFGISPLVPSPVCPDDILVDTRVHIHAGGDFVLELGPTGPREVLFNIVSEAEGHGEGGHEEGGEEHGGEEGGHEEGGEEHGGEDEDHA